MRNKVHNRYMDILPNPATRVPLPLIDNDPTTEYINANWVRGPNGKSPKYYIAAMGPKPATVNNYWRMLWQERPFAIVMITGLVEKGTRKCERYWPGLADGRDTLTFGDIRVVTTASQPKDGYVRSTLRATGPGPDGRETSWEYEHFWYNTWPDHGVPRTPRNPLFTDDTIKVMS